jgi:hypothetical protein
MKKEFKGFFEKKFNKVLGISILILAIFGTVYSVMTIKEYISGYNQINLYTKKLYFMNKKINDFNNEYIKEELPKFFNEEELRRYVIRYIDYNLNINGHSIIENSFATLDKNLRVIFTESVNSSEILPAELIKRYMTIPAEHMKLPPQEAFGLDTNLEYTFYNTEQGNIRQSIYTFKDVPCGSTINFKLNPQISYKMKLKSSNIEIFKN